MITILIIAFTVLGIAACITGVGHVTRGRGWTGAGMLLSGLAMSFMPFVIIWNATR